MGGEARLGAVVYEFNGREVAISHVDVAGLSPYWIGDVMQEVYPPHQG